MKGLTHWQKVCVWIALGLFVIGVIGFSVPAQKLLRGDAAAGETPFHAHERILRAGLAPLYCFLPGVLLVGFVTISVSWTRFREAQKVSNDMARKK